LYAPVRTLVVQELRAGHLPLWNPYEGTGKPLFAEGIHSVLHPVSLLGALLAPSSIDFLILVWLVAAALGAFLLARSLAASPTASAAAGLAFALSGFSVSMTGNLVFLAGLSTLPWLLAAARSAGMGARWGLVATALATACAFLSGDAQVALVGLILGILLAADAGGLRGLARAAVGMGAGLLLAAVQILPTAALLPRTYRSLESSDWEKARWALPPARLLEWIVPGIARGPLRELPATASGSPVPSVFAESVYLGAPLLVAAALGWAALRCNGRRRTALLLGGACLALLWLALGHHLGARQLLGWVPIWSRFRYTEKLMAPLTLCVAALAALGVDAFGVSRLSPRWRRALGALTLTAAAAFIVLSIAPAASGLAERIPGEAAAFHLRQVARGLPHLIVLLAALLAADRLPGERRRVLALALLLAAAPVAALRYAAHFGSPVARGEVSPLRLETDSPPVRLLHPEEELLPTNDPDGPVEGSAHFNRRFLRPATNVAARVDTVEPFGAFDPGRLTTLVRSLGFDWMRALRRFGLTHVAVVLPYDEASRAATAAAVEGGRLVQREPGLNFELWAVPHRPWAFFPRRVIVQPTPEYAHMFLLDVLASPGADETVVLEAKDPPRTAPGRVLGFERGTGTVRVEAEADAPSLLVVQDAFWPGWRATVDGRPAEILAADFLVRAVRWPAGRHRLVMTYDPPELRLGLALSALGAVLVLLLAIKPERR
ncbi:MAG: hypothetical protein WCC48_02010, partial [Anaeromyxobacteraceae bacterium]